MVAPTVEEKIEAQFFFRCSLLNQAHTPALGIGSMASGGRDPTKSTSGVLPGLAIVAAVLNI